MLSSRPVVSIMALPFCTAVACAPGVKTPSLCDLGPFCGAPVDTGGPVVGEPIDLVPSAGLPTEGMIQAANNNLDVAFFEGRLYLAFRTAPTHFASPDVELVVVSTTDLSTYREEARFAMERDIREPRFLVVDRKLHLYFVSLGTDATAFEPGQAFVVVRERAGWSEAAAVFTPGFIPWRGKNEDGRSILVGHRSSGDLAAPGGPEIGGQEVHVLTTEDGQFFRPAFGSSAVVLEGGNSEADYAIDGDGLLLAVARNGYGDPELGFGSKVCRAEAADHGVWRCVGDARRFDSPLVFASEGEVFLIARRNVTTTGAFDLERRDLDVFAQREHYATDYWSRPKRCSVWRVNPDPLSVDFIVDLPSAGDTCFASALHLTGRRWLVFNYTSDLSEPDQSWLSGQMGPTKIYAVVLDLPAAESGFVGQLPAIPEVDPTEPQSIRCGDAVCRDQSIGLGTTEFPVAACCPGVGHACGVQSDDRPVDAFDITARSLLGLVPACWQMESEGSDCSEGVCDCPDHELGIESPLDGRRFVVPLRGCCRQSDSRCGYRMDFEAANPALPVTLGMNPGCMDPNDLEAARRGPADSGLSCAPR